jgi:hypothetical protein
MQGKKNTRDICQIDANLHIGYIKDQTCKKRFAEHVDWHIDPPYKPAWLFLSKRKKEQDQACSFPIAPGIQCRLCRDGSARCLAEYGDWMRHPEQ